MTNTTDVPLFTATALGLRHRRGLVVAGLLAAVIALDQATKWWGWRHAAKAIINTGGTWFVGGPVSEWFRGPVSGALLDLLNVGLLSLAGVVLVRRRLRPLLLVAGALMVGGWGSNLLDRLGLHTVTAPGSPRGAIDFLPLGPAFYNVADVFIAAATALYLVAACARVVRRHRAAATTRAMTPKPSPRAWGVRLTRVAAVGLVATGCLTPSAVAAWSDGVAENPRSSAAASTPPSG
jgi:lipoprotein signal peptidase